MPRAGKEESGQTATRFRPGRAMDGGEAERFGFYNRLCEPDAVLAEAQAQAICMQTKDYERAYEAFVKKQKPVFNGD